MKGALLLAVLVAGVFLAAALFTPDDPRTTAKLKCEFAIEQTTGYDVPIMDVSRAIVTGDVYNGTVTLPFTVGGIQRRGECVFRDGRIGRISVDGKILAGRP